MPQDMVRLFRSESAVASEGPRAVGEDALRGRWFSSSQAYIEELNPGGSVSYVDVPREMLDSVNANYHRSGGKETYNTLIDDFRAQLRANKSSIPADQYETAMRATGYDEFVLPRDVADRAVPLGAEPPSTPFPKLDPNLETHSAREVRAATRARFTAEGTPIPDYLAESLDPKLPTTSKVASEAPAKPINPKVPVKETSARVAEEVPAAARKAAPATAKKAARGFMGLPAGFTGGRLGIAAAALGLGAAAVAVREDHQKPEPVMRAAPAAQRPTPMTPDLSLMSGERHSSARSGAPGRSSGSRGY